MRSNGVTAAALALGFASCWITSGESAFAGSECGSASWYGLGGQTANGEDIVAGALTAAHRTLPFGTRVKVENLGNGRTVVVRVNDRGPFVPGRLIDVTRSVAEKLGFIRAGLARVRMTVVGDGPMNLDSSCGKQEIGNRQGVAATGGTLPRELPETSLAVRFGDAFRPSGQTSGAKSLARQLATRMIDLRKQVATNVLALQRERPETSFAMRFGYAFLPTDETPEAGRVARDLTIRALAVLPTLASTQ